MCEGPVCCSVLAREKEGNYQKTNQETPKIYISSHAFHCLEHEDRKKKQPLSSASFSNAFREAFRESALSIALPNNAFASCCACFASLLGSGMSTAFYWCSRSLLLLLLLLLPLREIKCRPDEGIVLQAFALLQSELCSVVICTGHVLHLSVCSVYGFRVSSTQNAVYARMSSLAIGSCSSRPNVGQLRTVPLLRVGLF